VKSITIAVISLILITAISGCTKTSTPSIDVVETHRQRPELILPQMTEIKSLPVEWIVVTQENAEQKFNEMSEQGRQPVLFSLTTENYENLGMNQTEFLRLIREQRAIIVAYKNYYEKN